MGKPELAPRDRTPKVTNDDARPGSLLKRYWDLLAVLLLILGSFPTVWLTQRSVTFVPNLGLIDDNWHLDSTFKALRGIWIGRDVAFTHGPIFQWLSAIPAHSLPLSFGALYATWNTIPIWCAFLFAYLALRLILPEQPAWKRFVLLLMLAAFWETSFRSTFPVLLFAMFLRAWYAVRAGRLRSANAGAAGAVLCAIAFLIAGDVGIYATAGWFICCFAIAVEMRREKFFGRLLEGVVSFAVAAVALALIINSFMARPFDFKFWSDSLAQVAAYRWATPVAMTSEGTMHLFGALAICAAIFLVRALRRVSDPVQLTQRTAFLLGAFLFGLAVLQSALVRSDVGHVIIGEFALTFFAAAILFSFDGRLSLAGVVVAMAVSVLFSHSVFRSSNITRLYGELRHPLTECPASYSEFDQACYADPLTPRMLKAGGDFLSRNSAGNDFVFVFPYQTMLGLAAQRNVAGGLMQPYTASGPSLSRLEIAGVEGQSVPAALFFTDADYRHMSQPEMTRWAHNYLSVPVDGVLNFTRAPEVWFWMVQHYRLSEQLTPGVVGLLRDDSRSATVTFPTQSLGIASRSYPVPEPESVIDLGAPNWAANSDFIRLRINVRYPVWWKLRKPERLQLEIARADGTRERMAFIVQPNTSSDIWFYPWGAPDLARYFNRDQTQWRSPIRPSIIRLRIVVTPLDWISQQPESIRIEAADAVTMLSTAQQ